MSIATENCITQKNGIFVWRKPNLTEQITGTAKSQPNNSDEIKSPVKQDLALKSVCLLKPDFKATWQHDDDACPLVQKGRLVGIEVKVESGFPLANTVTCYYDEPTSYENDTMYATFEITSPATRAKPLKETLEFSAEPVEFKNGIFQKLVTFKGRGRDIFERFSNGAIIYFGVRITVLDSSGKKVTTGAKQRFRFNPNNKTSRNNYIQTKQAQQTMEKIENEETQKVVQRLLKLDNKESSVAYEPTETEFKVEKESYCQFPLTKPLALPTSNGKKIGTIEQELAKLRNLKQPKDTIHLPPVMLNPIKKETNEKEKVNDQPFPFQSFGHYQNFQTFPSSALYSGRDVDLIASHQEILNENIKLKKKNDTLNKLNQELTEKVSLSKIEVASLRQLLQDSVQIIKNNSQFEFQEEFPNTSSKRSIDAVTAPNVKEFVKKSKI